MTNGCAFSVNISPAQQVLQQREDARATASLAIHSQQQNLIDENGSMHLCDGLSLGMEALSGWSGDCWLPLTVSYVSN